MWGGLIPRNYEVGMWRVWKYPGDDKDAEALCALSELESSFQFAEEPEHMECLPNYGMAAWH